MMSELIYLRDQKGGTPLHCAASIGHCWAVRKILLEDNLSALERNTKGYLPIHVACKKGHVNVVKKLVNDPEWLDPTELLNREGQNILHVAAKNGKHEVVEYILREKKLENLLNEKNNNGNTSLHLAAQNLHTKVLLSLTQEKTVDVNLVNNQGLTAADYVLLRREVVTFRELLSHAILYSAEAPISEKGKRLMRTQSIRIERIKKRSQTLTAVAMLVASVTFAAGFTTPGGLNSSEDLQKRGAATLVNRRMFQIFTICDVVAMYTSIIGSIILFWIQLGNLNVATSATMFAFYLVGLALVTMSVAFMAGVHLVVSDLHWLAGVVTVIGIFFLSMFLAAYFLLIFPKWVRVPFFRHISCLILRIIILFSGRYDKLAGKKEKKTAAKQQQNWDEPGQIRIEMP